MFSCIVIIIVPVILSETLSYHESIVMFDGVSREERRNEDPGGGKFRIGYDKR